MDNKSTEQVSITPPEKRNPTGKGGFGDNPQNRNPGGWNKEMVFSYQYRRFMNMTLKELDDYRSSDFSDRKVVEELAYLRVMEAKKSLLDVKEITDRTEGKAAQSIDVTTNGENLSMPIVRIIDERPTTRDSSTE
jgi:hypothetical protein